MGLAQVATITVTYNPDIALLREQLHALPHECPGVLVDNASEPALRAQIETLATQRPGTVLLRNADNAGLAAAINQGAKAMRDAFPQARFLLLLDQDSLPEAGSIASLLDTIVGLQAQGKRPGCVGPMLLDVTTGMQHGFHQMTRWRWTRVFPHRGSAAPVRCANLNGSGTLVPLELFIELGGLEDALFIDHVDTEWSFRVQSHGYSLYGVPAAVFQHRMGEASRRIWLLGWRVWPWRSPLRHRYLFRNTLWLMRRSHVPAVWKFWAAIKLLLTTSVHAAADPRRGEQLRAMRQGLVEGLRAPPSGIIAP